MNGKIHSIETMGTLDGPGLRTVVFMQGCMNECAFCHNPDAALRKGGTTYSTYDLVSELKKGLPYWQAYSAEEQQLIKGGVTFSGGDPLYQPEFLIDLCAELKKLEIHVVIDTSANANFSYIQTLIPLVDLWMISLKQMHDALHQELIHASNKPILQNVLKLDTALSAYNQKHQTDVPKQIRIRFVIIPTLTDSEEHLTLLGQFIAQLQNIEAVELLPYSTIGRQKWIELFGHYKLDGIPDATAQDVERTKNILSKIISFPFIIPTYE